MRATAVLTATANSSFSLPTLRPSLRAPSLAGGFVLLVDDDPYHRIPLRQALRDRGHRVRSAADAPSVESVCRTSPLEIDALVACADLRSMGGFELARRVIRMRPEVRVLLVWRRPAGVEEVRRAHEHGFEVIEEPFTPGELCYRLNGLLDSQHGDARPSPRLVGEVLAIDCRGPRLIKEIDPWNRNTAKPKAWTNGRRPSRTSQRW